MDTIKKDIDTCCIICENNFVFTVKEQDFYDIMKFTNPRRCKPCRKERKYQQSQGYERRSIIPPEEFRKTKIEALLFSDEGLPMGFDEYQSSKQYPRTPKRSKNPRKSQIRHLLRKFMYCILSCWLNLLFSSGLLEIRAKYIDAGDTISSDILFGQLLDTQSKLDALRDVPDCRTDAQLRECQKHLIEVMNECEAKGDKYGCKEAEKEWKKIENMFEMLYE